MAINISVTTEFFNSDDPRFLRYGKGRKSSDHRWSQCPLGKSFFVEATEEQVRNNKKRPSIPAKYLGCFSTQALQQP